MTPNQVRSLHQAAPRLVIGRGLEDDQQSPREASLEAAFAADVEQALLAFYALPLSADWSNRIDDSVDEIIEWLLDIYGQASVARAAFADIINRFGVAAFNLGGQMALNFLGLLASFNLTNREQLDLIRERSNELTGADGDQSVIITTANEIARQVVKAREAAPDASAAAIVQGLGTWAASRSVIRSIVIAENESVLQSRVGVIWASIKNGSRDFIYICEPDVEEKCTTGVCIPWCGRDFRASLTGSIPRWAKLPKHPHCRCKHRPNLAAWEAPDTIYTGE